MVLYVHLCPLWLLSIITDICQSCFLRYRPLSLIKFCWKVITVSTIVSTYTVLYSRYSKLTSKEIRKDIEKTWSCIFVQLLSCVWLCNPMDCSTPGFPVFPYILEFTQAHVNWVGDAIQLSHLLSPLLLPSIFPSIRVFSNELLLCIRWPNYWSFGFSISPSNEYSELISFRTDWFDLFAVHVTLNSIVYMHTHTHTCTHTHIYIWKESESRSVVSDALRPHGLQSISLWNSPGQYTGVDSRSLLQGSNPGLLHCREIPYQLSHQGSPYLSVYIFVIKITRLWYCSKPILTHELMSHRLEAKKQGVFVCLFVCCYVLTISFFFFLSIYFSTF